MKQLEVRILDRSFRVQVPPADAARLQEAAHRVDAKMREVQNASRGSLERVAVHAALQIAFEQGPAAAAGPDPVVLAELEQLCGLADQAIARATEALRESR